MILKMLINSCHLWVYGGGNEKKDKWKRGHNSELKTIDIASKEIK